VIIDRRPARWSEAKRLVFQERPGLVLTFLLAVSLLGLLAGLGLREGIRWRAVSFFAAGIAAAGISLGVSTLADVLDLLRHLQIYTAVVDVLFAATLGMWIARKQDVLNTAWDRATRKLGLQKV
jgi:hypothetical protein